MSVVGILCLVGVFFAVSFATSYLFCRMCRGRDDVDRYRKQGQKAALDALEDLHTHNQARREDESR